MENKWIDVKERLPSPNEQVLIYSKCAIRLHGTITRYESVDVSDREMIEYKSPIKHSGIRIVTTHWQPLPTPPNK